MTALAQTGATGTDRGSRARARGLRSSARALPLLPAALLLAIFLLGPILVSLWGSLTNATLSGSTAVASEFIGFDNYAQLFKAPDFPVSVINTIVFVFFSAVIGQNILGLALALMMRSGNRIVTAVVGTIVVTAWVLPEIVAAFAAYAFFRDNGTLNSR